MYLWIIYFMYICPTYLYCNGKIFKYTIFNEGPLLSSRIFSGSFSLSRSPLVCTTEIQIYIWMFGKLLYDKHYTNKMELNASVKWWCMQWQYKMKRISQADRFMSDAGISITSASRRRPGHGELGMSGEPLLNSRWKQTLGSCLNGPLIMRVGVSF